MATVVDTRVAYRDATWSSTTQDSLIRLLSKLTREAGWNEGERGEEVHALAQVVERWAANDATQVLLHESPCGPLRSKDPKFADASVAVWEADCPGCGELLGWAIETPPIPRTFFTWLDPDGERRIDECPHCHHDLPDGDLTKQERHL
jgi:hypothetical protein